MLAEGMSAPEVAADLGIVKRTVEKWRQIPEFQTEVDHALTRYADQSGLASISKARETLARDGAPRAVRVVLAMLNQVQPVVDEIPHEYTACVLDVGHVGLCMQPSRAAYEMAETVLRMTGVAIPDKGSGAPVVAQAAVIVVSSEDRDAARSIIDLVEEGRDVDLPGMPEQPT